MVEDVFKKKTKDHVLSQMHFTAPYVIVEYSAKVFIFLICRRFRKHRALPRFWSEKLVQYYFAALKIHG